MTEWPRDPHAAWPWRDNLPSAFAIRQVATGQATPDQQRLAITTIVEGIARYYDLSYRPGDHAATDFAEGKRYVGSQLVTLVNMNDLRPDDEVRKHG